MDILNLNIAEHNQKVLQSFGEAQTNAESKVFLVLGQGQYGTLMTTITHEETKDMPGLIEKLERITQQLKESIKSNKLERSISSH
jgi:hypothetical protein